MIGFLYGQTEYNMLKNTIFLDKYINYAKKNNYKFISITDSNMYGYLKFFSLCKKNNIKPLIGLELNIKSFDSKDNVILLYAKNNTGFHNLLKISSKNKITNNSLELNDLLELSNGLFMVTGGNSCDLNRLLIEGICDEFIFRYGEYKNIFSDVFIGLEMQIEHLKGHNVQLYNQLENNNYITLPIHRTLYLEKEDKVVYEAFIKISSNFETCEEGDYFFPNEDDLVKNFFSMKNIFLNLEMVISNIEEITINSATKLPKFYDTKGLTSKDYLQTLCQKGLEKRLRGQSVNYNIYYKRLIYELDVINQMDYNDYFLIVWDFVKYAKQNDILVGPGRGSAAGSLVSYCLGITNVDPIKYDLLFERFLNIERITMPDIDMDFPDDKRDEVIRYVTKLYGKNRVCNISAYGTFLVKSSIRDLGRVFKIDTRRLDTIIKMVQENEYEDILKRVVDNSEIFDLLVIAKKIEGLPRHISTHAAGIILSDESLFNIIPLQNGINQMYQSQLEATDLEKLGLLKIDFLGIKNLSIINNVIKEIPLNFIELSNIPLNDLNTFRLLQSADTVGVFQLESAGVKNVLKKLRPSTFEDLVAVLALYRPGPMDNIDEFILRKHGKKYNYIHQDLKDILHNTYGIIVYQEQIMKIALKFAKYTLAEADLLRRAVSKKDETTLLKQRENFVTRSLKCNYTIDIANEIYDDIVKFANYGFNRSHAVAYAIVAYQMAYLKANYFPIFISKLMNNVISSQTALASYIRYAKEKGVGILKPCINNSMLEFVRTSQGLYFPLQGIYQIGETLSKEIILERQKGKFLSYDDFKTRVPSVNSRALEWLVFSGCFDSFGLTKKEMIEFMASNNDIMNKFIKDLKTAKEYDEDYLKQKELEALGINIEYDIFKNIQELISFYKTTLLNNIKENFNANVIISFDEIKEFTTKNNTKMAGVKLSDSFSKYDGVIFSDRYELLKAILSTSALYLANVTKIINKQKDNDIQIRINHLKAIS